MIFFINCRDPEVILSLPTAQLSGLQLCTASGQHLFQQLCDWTESRHPMRIYVLRAGVIQESQTRPRLKQILQDADLLIPGGYEVALAMALENTLMPHFSPPKDWWEPLVAFLASRNATICYVGGPPGAASTWAAGLEMCHPGLKVLSWDGRFEKWGPENDRVLRQIKAVKPTLVVVGLGSPFQEEYAHAHADLFQAPLVLTMEHLAEKQTGIWPDGPIPEGPLHQFGSVMGQKARAVAAALSAPALWRDELKRRE